MYSDTKRILEDLEQRQHERVGFPPEEIYPSDEILKQAVEAGSVGRAGWGSAGKGFLAGALFSMWTFATDQEFNRSTYDMVASGILFGLVLLIVYWIARGIEKWDKLELYRRTIILDEARYIIASESPPSDRKSSDPDDEYAQGYFHGVEDCKNGDLDESIYPPNL
jgi:hypothetical protein